MESMVCHSKQKCVWRVGMPKITIFIYHTKTAYTKNELKNIFKLSR
jgi:hypothetical protein